MRIINKTNLPKDLIQKIVAKIFAKTAKYVKSIYITYDKTYNTGGSYYFEDGRIQIIIAEPEFYPCMAYERSHAKFGYINFRLKSDIEALIFCLAHESRHTWQDHISKQNWFKNAKTIQIVEKKKEWVLHSFKAEKNADLFAIKCVKQYRKLKYA